LKKQTALCANQAECQVLKISTEACGIAALTISLTMTLTPLTPFNQPRIWRHWLNDAPKVRDTKVSGNVTCSRLWLKLVPRLRWCSSDGSCTRSWARDLNGPKVVPKYFRYVRCWQTRHKSSANSEKSDACFYLQCASSGDSHAKHKTYHASQLLLWGPWCSVSVVYWWEDSELTAQGLDHS